MTLWYRHLFGAVDEFAVEVGFMNDPDEGHGARPTMAASWGSLRIFVRGQEPTAAVGPDAESTGGVQWYLLPFLTWLAEGWDALLHESHVRFRRSAPTIATCLADASITFDPMGNGSDAWEFQERHALVSAREGGIFPNIVFLRHGDSVEISWDDDDRPGGGPLRFLQPIGSELVPVEAFAQVMYDLLKATADELHRHHPSDEFAQLVQTVAAIENPGDVRRRERTAWLIGLRRNLSETLEFWTNLVARGIEIPDAADHGLFSSPGLPAMLFASINPTPSEGDLRTLASIPTQMQRMSEEVLNLVRRTYCPTSHPHRSGYGLALEARRRLGLGSQPVCIDDLLGRLGFTDRKSVV